jgi:hypothetical protein
MRTPTSLCDTGFRLMATTATATRSKDPVGTVDLSLTTPMTSLDRARTARMAPTSAG